MYPFNSPTTIVITGGSQTGKTTWLANLIVHANTMFSGQLTRQILYCYWDYQPIFFQLEKLVPNITFKHGMPTIKDVDDLTDNEGHTILIVDDMMDLAVNNALLKSLFYRGCHHRNLSAVYLNQNYYQKGSATTTINRNAHYIVYFETADVQPVSILDRQMEAGGCLVEAYKDAVSNWYGYLVIDRAPRRVRHHQWRTRIFPGEATVIYTLKSASLE